MGNGRTGRPAFGTAFRGYDCAEVDGLIDRIERTFAGTAGPDALTCDAIQTSVFSVVLRGYREDEVDAYLDQVVAELERSAVRVVETEDVSWTDLIRERAELLRCAGLPREQRFPRKGAFGAGYAVADVDAFVDHVRATLASSLTPADVSQVRFATARRGYDEGAVDDWLERVEAHAIRARQSS